MEPKAEMGSVYPAGNPANGSLTAATSPGSSASRSITARTESDVEPR